jgi:WD40 repeat protein
LAFNPDGHLLVTANSNIVQFLDAYTGKILGELPITFVSSSLAFSPDGKILAVGSRDGTVHVFNIK